MADTLKRPGTAIAIGLAGGAGLGVALGLAMDSVGSGLPIGVAIGAAIGVAVEYAILGRGARHLTTGQKVLLYTLLVLGILGVVLILARYLGLLAS